MLFSVGDSATLRLTVSSFDLNYLSSSNMSCMKKTKSCVRRIGSEIPSNKRQHGKFSIMYYT